MKVSYNWLKEFVDVTASPEEIASRFALSGTNIAAVENGPSRRGDRRGSHFESARIAWACSASPAKLPPSIAFR